MLLAIDTATRTASLALHDGGQVRYEATWEAGRRHTVQLAPRLFAALEDLGLGAEDLTAVAVTTGPGSFTGLRVGMALAKGLSMARNLPLVGIPTLDVVAAAQGRDRRPLIAVLQAGRGRICTATYRWRNGWQRRDGPRLTTWEDLARTVARPTLFCGEVDERGRTVLEELGDLAIVLPPAWRLRRAGFLAELAWGRLRRGETDDPATLTPIYLHSQ
ncbi:MAG TPA: tRNA (adenosine(37)-N6)-threonylcarbamoyltransferase complex dimerization subunit type 1 TsaB [Chloroflexi bacterium]|nr:tRNA (adenosine(37)-N6)-threonylcarbamoyltransferase complex dimerization subunit type 1 TsaB [Chloroflexota bacterium]